MNENKSVFVFPDDLQSVAKERLNLPAVPPDYLRDTACFQERIAGVCFKKPGQMIFFLDGRRSGICELSKEECGWLDTGQLSPLQVATHYAVGRKTKFTRNSIERTLFD